MAELSRLVRELKPSATIILSGRVREMKAEGIDVVSFTIGEPDFDTPEYIKQEAARAMKEGFTKYTPAAGIKELREALSEKLARDNGAHFSPDEIIATSGGKQALSLVFQVLCDPGQEVLIPSPYWVSYVEQVKISGGIPKILRTDESTGFKITPAMLREAATPAAKALVINSPSNPTGMVYTGEELREISSCALELGITVISDEVYETIMYGGRKHVSIASLGDDHRSNTVIVNSFSKTYSMPGWRIGYAAGEAGIIKSMVKIQSQTTSHPDSIAQRAALGALKGPQDDVERMRCAFEERKDLIVGLARGIEGFECLEPEGAFYIFPNVRSLYGRNFNGKQITNSTELSEILLEEAKTAVVPGAEFGADENIRISYAAGEDAIREGMKRIGELVCGMKG